MKTEIMKNTTVKITKAEKKVFDYLNDLRESGVTNMFGAGSYIERSFSLDRKKASDILGKWMQNFNENGYDDLVE